MSLANTGTNSTQFYSSGRQKMRVFLEGREVPSVVATFTAAEDQPNMCTVELPPLSIIKFIRPRTQLHVFARDPFTFGDNDYHLAFEGEVMGRTMTKRHDGRSFMITAYDYSNYWDDAHAYIMNPQFVTGKLTTQVSQGDVTPQQQAKAKAEAVIDAPANATSAIIKIMAQQDGQGSYDLVTGILNVVAKIAYVNEFYRAAWERLRITDRMISYPSGNLGPFLKNLGVEDFLSSFNGMCGGDYSLRQLLMNVLSLIFHTSISVPFPSFLKIKTGSREGYGIVQFLFVPDGYTLPPPKCNVIFPNQQSSFTFDEDFRAAPTRYGFRAGYPLYSGVDSTDQTTPIQYYPTCFSDYMMNAKNNGNAITASAAEIASALGPSTITKSSDGRTYSNIFYGQPAKANAVNTSFSTTLKESDYLSNEEALKGIYYQTDVLLPAYSALFRYGTTVAPNANGVPTPTVGTTPDARNAFTREVGKYLFYKKRYESRNVSSSIMFHPFLVPGFNCLLIDDSDAGQSVIAKLKSVTHRMAHDGWTTQIALNLGRDFDEIDFLSGGLGEPPLPAWFDPTIFGQTDAAGLAFFKQETTYLADNSVKAITPTEAAYRNKYVLNPTTYPNLSKFYQATIGCDAITKVGPAPQSGSKTPQEVYVTTRGATQAILAKYKGKLKKDGKNRDAYVRSFINRPVATMTQAFNFLGASAPQTPTSTSGGKQFPDSFATVQALNTQPLPYRFDGGGSGGVSYSDQTAIALRRQIIDAYQALLKAKGPNGGAFRG